MLTTPLKVLLAAFVMACAAAPARASEIPVDQLRNCTVLSRLFGTETGAFHRSPPATAFRDDLLKQFLAEYPADRRNDTEVMIAAASVAAGVERKAILGYPALYFQHEILSGKTYAAALAELRRTYRGMRMANVASLFPLYKECVEQIATIERSPPKWAVRSMEGYFVWPEYFNPLVWDEINN